MKATLLKAPGQLKIEEVPVPSCPACGILVKVKACAICTSDMKMAESGHPAVIYPCIPGHEISGVVAESKIKDLKEGDRIQVAPGLKCGKCLACKKGADNKCKHVGIFGFNYNGGFAEFLSVPLKGSLCGSVNIIPEKVTFEEASLTEPLACCINAQELSRVNSGDTVLILGAGPMGCLNAMLAKIKGAQKVFLADTVERRRKLAERTEADWLIDPGQKNVYDLVMQETSGWGIDVVILASSEAGPAEDIIRLLAPRGRICLFSGLVSGKDRTSFDLNLIHYTEASLIGAYGNTAVQNAEAIRLISNRKIDVKWLITKRISLA
ncbi:MAG: alcohol dehydrogenase catalytic domain-containing protein, partial [Thermodesulfobacteriota bacterium]|nr:alcohol dehydrogenase catalytic domain-containing protein [Thermodesulfobacteriota bacterium]